MICAATSTMRFWLFHGASAQPAIGVGFREAVAPHQDRLGAGDQRAFLQLLLGAAQLGLDLPVAVEQGDGDRITTFTSGIEAPKTL